MKSNAEVAQGLVDQFDVHCGGCCSLNEYAKLQGDIESALTRAQSQLAGKVLADIDAWSWHSADADLAEKRLHDLFNRMGIEVEGERKR